ncbi:uncharacterized protein LOC143837566 [Paroedura picta]|uniref:uncharacterized protein LOC143837566 n=1 Tax=Paroedura picta TaxID=143630 RepID=UPI004055C853
MLPDGKSFFRLAGINHTTQSPSKLATAPEREEGEEEGPSTSGQAAAETVEARLRAMEARVTSLEAQVAELKGEIEQQRQQREAEERRLCSPLPNSSHTVAKAT